MADRRIRKHPILGRGEDGTIRFTFNGRSLLAREGEVISSALFAAGITVFGHHHRDVAPQGVFCANGQCSQCTVIANGKPVKACMEPVVPGMEVTSLEGLASLDERWLPEDAGSGEDPGETEVRSVRVLVIGGGPAGLNAAIELGQLGVEVLVVDDKQDLGGKLCLQTHNFFGSVADCYAGTRGIDIAHLLADRLAGLQSVEVWLESTVVGVFSDKLFGVSSPGRYRLVKADAVLVATGAREKTLVFPGSDLPGVYGAGAFQTLVNRDLVKCSSRLFIIGGGNVGIIAAYHALQAGIDVVGVVEALPKCGGYKVHEDKIVRLGIPVWTSHTVIRVEGEERVERAVVAQIDDRFHPVPGTQRVFDVDTVLVAVGLSPVDELLAKAGEYGVKAYAAGDAEEIAEASAAIFSGKIVGRRIARELGLDISVPGEWGPLAEILRSKPGETLQDRPQCFATRPTYSLFGRNLFRHDPATGRLAGGKIARVLGIDVSAPEQMEPVDELLEVRPDVPVLMTRHLGNRVYPVLRCAQKIPCNPCAVACPLDSIFIDGTIMDLPEFSGKCQGCGKCVLACPGLAITLVVDDYDPTGEYALVMAPFELEEDALPEDMVVKTTGFDGDLVGTGRIVEIIEEPHQDRRKLVLLEVPYDQRDRVAGFRVREPEQGMPLDDGGGAAQDDPVVCLCERVRRSEIVSEIRRGVRDMNQLKASVRSGMGACGGKTCTEQILRLFRAEGVNPDEVTRPTIRPFVKEVHLGDFLTEPERQEDQ